MKRASDTKSTANLAPWFLLISVVTGVFLVFSIGSAFNFSHRANRLIDQKLELDAIRMNIRQQFSCVETLSVTNDGIARCQEYSPIRDARGHSLTTSNGQFEDTNVYVRFVCEDNRLRFKYLRGKGHRNAYFEEQDPVSQDTHGWRDLFVGMERDFCNKFLGIQPSNRCADGQVMVGWAPNKGPICESIHAVEVAAGSACAAGELLLQTETGVPFCQKPALSSSHAVKLPSCGPGLFLKGVRDDGTADCQPALNLPMYCPIGKVFIGLNQQGNHVCRDVQISITSSCHKAVAKDGWAQCRPGYVATASQSKGSSAGDQLYCCQLRAH